MKSLTIIGINAMVIVTMAAAVVVNGSVKVYEDLSYTTTDGASGCIPWGPCSTLFNWETGKRENKTINKIKYNLFNSVNEVCDSFYPVVKCGAGVNTQTDVIHYQYWLGDWNFFNPHVIINW